MDERAMICPECARSNVADAMFCTWCGATLDAADRALSAKSTWSASSHSKPGWRRYDDIPVSPLARKVAFVIIGVVLVVGLFAFAHLGGAPSSVLTPIYGVGDGTCQHTPPPHATPDAHSWICRRGHWIAQH